MRERTPWFPARKWPVHDGAYELRCNGLNGWRQPQLWTRRQIIDCSCRMCEWRGLTKPAKERSDG